MLEQDDGLGIHDLAVAGHGESLGEIELHQLDVLAFAFKPSALVAQSALVINPQEQADLFGQRAGAGIDVANVADALGLVAGFLERFAGGRNGRRFAIEQAGSSMAAALPWS